MNAYLVQIHETREAYVSTAITLEPPEPWRPTGVFLAETPAQAKRDALNVWEHQPRSGVYGDDWNALRVRLLFHDARVYDGESGLDVDAPRGELVEGPLYNLAWIRVHEIEDHGGATCDCPEMEYDDATGEWKAVA